MEEGQWFDGRLRSQDCGHRQDTPIGGVQRMKGVHSSQDCREHLWERGLEFHCGVECVVPLVPLVRAQGTVLVPATPLLGGG